MPPKLRVKGPVMSGSRVSLHTEYHVNNKKRVKKLTVVIKIDPRRLRLVVDPVSDTDSDLWSLDKELNESLQNSTQPLSQAVGPMEATEKTENRPEAPVAVKYEPGAMSDYRTIPKNLINTIDSELGDDLDMIEKVVVTLRDPLTATRIRLPVRSTACGHFECFDFEIFCQFSKIPEGVKAFIRKDLVKRSFESKRFEKIARKSNNPAAKYTAHPYRPIGHTYLPHIPTYHCPVCNAVFALHQLYISDVFNFFVKFTPNYVQRIEITDRIRYRIIDAETVKEAKKDDVVVLSDDSDDETSPGPPQTKQRIYLVPSPSPTHATRAPTSAPTTLPASDDVFDDGLDEQLAHLPPVLGSGSWHDPVTLD